MSAGTSPALSTAASAAATNERPTGDRRTVLEAYEKAASA
jgi:hypothetical protein